MSTLREFVAGLPKAELHVHHVGSASPRIVAELAARHAGSTPVPADPQRLAEYFTFTDFGHFITIYLSVVDLIRDPQDIWTLTYEIARELAAQSVRYAELTLTPYSSVVRGIPAEAFCEAVEDARGRARADFGVALRVVLRHPRRGRRARRPTSPSTSRLTQRPDGLVSFGLGGPEAGVPREQFAPHFAAARAAGLHSVPHAGESTGPESIWDALDHLGAERIGHGIAAARDPRAARRTCAERAIPLEVCPTSNVRTRSVPSLAEHPLPALVAAGVPVTINSDDPPMFSTTLDRRVPRGRRPAGPGRGRAGRPGPRRGARVVPRRRPARPPCSPRSTPTPATDGVREPRRRRRRSRRRRRLISTRARPVHVPPRAGDDPAGTGRLQVPRRARPGHLRRQGQEPAAAAELLLRRRRRPAPAHPADGHRRPPASSGPWCAPRSRRCSSSTPGSRSSTRASTSSTATTSPTRRWP